MAAYNVTPLITTKADEAARQAHASAIATSPMPQFVKDHHEAILPTAHLKTVKDKPPQTVNDVPFWVVVSCALAMGLGTMAGGRRIIRTMGSKIIRLTPMQGFAAQTSGTGTIYAASLLGIPVSTTHCVTASIMGAGASKGLTAVRWRVATNIVVAWVLTLPASAGMAWLAMVILRPLLG
jgi:phosphate/sulfate permease